MQISSSNFYQNTAKSSGSVLLADDDSQITITDSNIYNNGNYSCYDPPQVSWLNFVCIFNLLGRQSRPFRQKRRLSP